MDKLMKKFSFFKANSFLMCCVLPLLLTSCARQISPDYYAASHVGETSTTYAGIIRNVRVVSIGNGDNLEGNALGVAGGGVAGCALGSAVGRGNAFATLGGALAGAVAGSLAEKKLKEQTGLEYIVQLDNGQLFTVVQGADCPLQVGQSVYVLVSMNGRSRMIPQ